MINVIVSYRVNSDFAETNVQNIEKFLQDFKNLDQSAFSYRILRKDGNSFVHISKYTDENIQNELLNVPSFLKFQTERDKNLTNEPKIEIFELTGETGNF